MLQSTGLGKFAPTGAPQSNGKAKPKPFALTIPHTAARADTTQWYIRYLIRKVS
jgi:hypothetical protein